MSEIAPNSNESNNNNEVTKRWLGWLVRRVELDGTVYADFSDASQKVALEGQNSYTILPDGAVIDD